MAKGWSWGWREAAGAVADLGVFIPIAVGLIVLNGLSATAVLLPAGCLYLMVGWRYRIPVSVQPLKAFGALAIAHGAGANVIAVGAITLGVVFWVAGALRWVDRAATLIPHAVVRGVQLSVGLLFAKIAWGLVDERAAWMVGAAVVCMASLLLRRWGVSLVWAVAGAVLMVVAATAGPGGATPFAWGPTQLTLVHASWADLVTATLVLVLPQLPLTFANACVAATDVSHSYFGDRAADVTPGRLARSLGAANVAAGAISGMPVCHGAGGITAHHAFGARTGGAPVMIGGVLVVLATAMGAGLAGVLPLFPVWILAGMLAAAGALHVGLVRDVTGVAPALTVAAVGVAGALGHLALALVAAVAMHHAAAWIRRRRRPTEPGGPPVSSPRRRTTGDPPA